MRDAGRRPMGRLLYWALILVAGFGLSAFGVPVPPQGGMATTTVSDTVYLADGTPASGTLILTWPSFVTSSGTAVAAGSTSAKLGANGALSIALAPNAGATPAGVYYTVVYQVGPGQVKTEYWMVPTNSPAKPGDGADYPGVGVGCAAGVDAVRKCSAGDQGGRGLGGAPEWVGDDQRDEDICQRSERAGAGGYRPGCQ